MAKEPKPWQLPAGFAAALRDLLPQNVLALSDPAAVIKELREQLEESKRSIENLNRQIVKLKASKYFVSVKDILPKIRMLFANSSHDEKVKFIGDICSMLNVRVIFESSAEKTLLSIPIEKEEKWLTHRLEDETPPAFIKRVWGTWIGQGLTSSHFFHADPPLYTAIRKWRKKHGWPADLDLPNKKQANDRALAERGVPSAADSFGRALREASPEVRENVRLYDVARRRQSRQNQVKSP